MRLYNGFLDILKIQKFRRIVSYTGFYCFTAVLSYAYTSNTGDQFYASYPAGTELLTDQAKLYKAALGNCFETQEWGPIEYCIMAKHFERQGKGLMRTMLNTWHIFYLLGNLMEVVRRVFHFPDDVGDLIPVSL